MQAAEFARERAAWEAQAARAAMQSEGPSRSPVDQRVQKDMH